MKQTKLNELNTAYNELLKSWYDGRSTRNTRNKKADIFISKFVKVEMFHEFFKTLSTQDKLVNSSLIHYVVLKFNDIRKTNIKTSTIIYN